MLNPRLLTTVAVTSAALLALGCGSKSKKKSEGAAAEPAPAAAEEVSAVLNVTTDGSGFELGSALTATTAAYSGSVAGCITGHSPVFTEGTASVALLVGDTGCYGRIDSVTVTFPDGSSSTYLPDAGYKFVNGTALIVTPSAAGPAMRIVVSAQFPATIAVAPAPSLAITLGFVQGGGSQSASARTASAGIDVNVSAAIPYQLAAIDLTVDGAAGGGAFGLGFNCYSVVGADGLCDTQTQTALSSAIAIDTYLTGLTPRDLTLAECTALATGASKRSPSSTKKQSDNVATLPNGGANFALVGPAPMCATANEKLVVALANAGTASCKWWRMTVDCP